MDIPLSQISRKIFVSVSCSVHNNFARLGQRTGGTVSTSSDGSLIGWKNGVDGLIDKSNFHSALPVQPYRVLAWQLRSFQLCFYIVWFIHVPLGVFERKQRSADFYVPPGPFHLPKDLSSTNNDATNGRMRRDIHLCKEAFVLLEKILGDTIPGEPS